MSVTNLGRVSIVPRGEWSVSTEYNRLDAVTHNGESWLAVQTSTGENPYDSVYWQKLADKGADGETFIWRGVWSASVSDYAKNDVVEYNGTTYIADRNPTQGISPEDDGTAWNLMALKGAKGDTGDKGDKGDTGEVTEAELSAGLERKLDIDGYSAMARVGMADDLAGKGDAIGASYTYRTSGGTESISDGTATIKSIKGNTIVWNQLVSTTAASRVVSGITFTNNGDGSWTISGTATADAVQAITNADIITGHKYALTGHAQGESSETYRLYNNNIAQLFYAAYDRIGTATVSGESYVGIVVMSGTVINTPVTFTPQFFDLTLMFGAGNEPSTIEEFKALYPEKYYPYNAGSLLSFIGNGIKTVGFNLFDEETKLLAIPLSAKVGEYYRFDAARFGTLYSNGIIDLPKGYTGQIEIKVNGYAVTVGNYPILYFVYSDGTESQSLGFAKTTTATDYTFTSDVGKVVEKIVTSYSDGGNVFVKDFCIHFAWSGVRNGEYEEYQTQTRNLELSNFNVSVDSTVYGGMKSVGNVYDEQTKDKDIRRIGVRAYTSGDDSDATVLTDRTVTYYVLASPVVTAHNPVLNLSYLVSDFGTEYIITADNAMTAPCDMEVIYGLGATDTVRTLPTNYTSINSLDGLLAALGTALNLTITKSWDASNNKYTFTVTQNGE